MRVIALDTETRDPFLKEKGPSWIYGEGELLGVSLSTDNGLDRWYSKKKFPIASIKDTVETTLSAYDAVVGANILYDFEWLAYEGFDLSDTVVYDIQIAERLLDTHAVSVSLETLGQKYFNESKATDELLEIGKSLGFKEDEVMGNLHLLPDEIVGKYAMQDTSLTLRIWKEQEARLTEKELMPAFLRECELIKVVHRMKVLGVPVDVGAANALAHDLQTRLDEIKSILDEANINADEVKTDEGKALLAKYCDERGIKYGTTQSTNKASFTRDWLETQSDPVLRGVAEFQELDKLRKDFVVGTVCEKHVSGRIHSSFHPLRSDTAYGKVQGTITGRFSSTRPNLTQIPIRHPEWGHKLRSLFIPDDDHTWVKFDYSQQEVRLLVHFAAALKMPKAQEIADIYKTNPEADFYNIAQDILKELGYDVDRGKCKTYVLGRQYGMGKAKTAVKFNLSEEETGILINKFNKAIPFVADMANYAASAANDRGYIWTLGRRKITFDLWAPAKWSTTFYQGLPHKEAIETYKGQGLKRADTYKALNYLIQGSAADMLKIAMLNIYKKYNLIPYLCVHDELDYPIKHDEVEKYLPLIKHEMENVFNLNVNMKVDASIGPSWGELVDV